MKKAICPTLCATIIFVFCTGAHAHWFDTDGILRSDDGSAAHVYQYQALKVCPEGTHLPTIREWAEEGQRRGAKGILEVNKVDPNEVPDGYRKIHALNFYGQEDYFYYNSTGYKRPASELCCWFWSSSRNSFYGPNRGYTFKRTSGRIEETDNHIFKSYVQCIAD